METNTTSSTPMPAGLPVRNNLKFVTALSWLIALLITLSALTGLLFPHKIYPTREVLLSFMPTDLFHLVIGLPILLGSMWLAKRGKLIGLLCWPGALLFVLYSFTTNLIGVPFGPLFLPYLLLVTLSAYAIAVLIPAIDAQTVRQQLQGRVPARAAGIVLLALTVPFILLAVGGIISAIIDQRPVGSLDLMLWIADLGTISPMCLFGGILLLQRKPLGYASGAGLLLVYTMLFFGLFPAMIYPALYDGTQIDIPGLAMMMVFGMITLFLFLRFARTADRV